MNTAVAILSGRIVNCPLIALLLTVICYVGSASPEYERVPPNGDVPDFLSYDEQEDRDYHSEYTNELDSLRQSWPIDNMWFVRLHLDVIANANSVNLSLPDEPAIVFDEIRITQDRRFDSDGWEWIGTSSERRLSKILLTIEDDSAYGSIQVYADSIRLYRIQPFEDEMHLVIRVDQSKLLEDRELDYGESANSELANNDLVPSQDCSIYSVIVVLTKAAAERISSELSKLEQVLRATIQETNESYRESGIGIKAELSYAYVDNDYSEAETTEYNLVNFQGQGDGALDEVHGHRNRVQADVAVLVATPERRDNRIVCGRAKEIGASAETAFAVVASDCLAGTGWYTFAHEIGHLQGARHNVGADPVDEPFEYGHGYLDEERNWRTIMAYRRWNDQDQCPNSGCPKINRWSDPSAGMGIEGVSNNARVLREQACVVAGWR